MSKRDSGIIDLFAIHKEEEERLSALPSAPPPAFSVDTGAADADDDLEALAASQRSLRKRAKIVGSAIGAVTLLGIVAIVFTSGGSSETPKTEAASAAPPSVATEVVPAPVPEPAPEPSTPLPPPPATAQASPDYTPATAAAAYAASRPKKKKTPRGKAKKGGVKLQKVQSSGI